MIEKWIENVQKTLVDFNLNILLQLPARAYAAMPWNDFLYTLHFKLCTSS
jgi:hypothetical protein